ncbi:hypothetical protein ONS95_002835 [Cadophora gregata]|uniref:uncharacterized protein n=1 Tax=Cadophora gregata TaxID=51156 RepID=UPI0026DB24B9|nr:uncharacterized protein ONS95_002835 [Cadophora gregata]KAK0110184.1 hypothetical protein ONS95_002835 [Cadophora gregata]KAK0110199.1 hypothetical protein ONS96_001822 [Cadophora gregata f. sp. sojae]
MKYSTIIQALLVALFSNIVYASVIDTRALTARDDQSPSTEDLIAYQLPDGRRRIDFYDNGALEGYAIETDNGATFYDIDGSEVSLADDDDSDLARRQSKWRLAIKFAKLIAKWGKRAWDYIYCVGASSMWRCGDDYVQCATQGTPPWACIEGIICVGVAARKC